MRAPLLLLCAACVSVGCLEMPNLPDLDDADAGEPPEMAGDDTSTNVSTAASELVGGAATKQRTWVFTYDVDFVPRALALSDDGEINLALEVAGDVAIARFSPAGERLWERGFGDAHTQWVNAIAAAPGGGVVFTGGSNGEMTGLTSSPPTTSTYVGGLASNGTPQHAYGQDTAEGLGVFHGPAGLWVASNLTVAAGGAADLAIASILDGALTPHMMPTALTGWGGSISARALMARNGPPHVFGVANGMFLVGVDLNTLRDTQGQERLFVASFDAAGAAYAFELAGDPVTEVTAMAANDDEMNVLAVYAHGTRLSSVGEQGGITWERDLSDADGRVYHALSATPDGGTLVCGTHLTFYDAQGQLTFERALPAGVEITSCAADGHEVVLLGTADTSFDLLGGDTRSPGTFVARFNPCDGFGDAASGCESGVGSDPLPWPHP